MTNPVKEGAEQPSYLNMSDEEIMAAGEPSFPAAAEGPAKEAPVAEVTPPDDEEDKDPVKEDEGADDETGAKPGEKKADAGEGKPAAEAKDPVDPKAAEEKVEKDPKEAKPAEAVIDFKAEYERLLAPFKANGRDIAVKSVDDAIALMQMGANYNKKMAALKPNLKLMKMLENNGLMNDEKIGFLIDLGKKDPAAISKLIKDSGIDPMDLDAEKANTYKQNTYTVDDREIDLDTVLEELSETPTYTRTLEIVSTKWDAASKQVIATSPQLLKVINGHVSTGIYDLISKEIESERVFGRLSGLSDIEAYRQVGDAIQARGGFNHLGSSQGQPKPAAVVVVPKPSTPEDDKLKEKRRAASSTKPGASGAVVKDFNPLALSDEEFAKLGNKQFF